MAYCQVIKANFNGQQQDLRDQKSKFYTALAAIDWQLSDFGVHFSISWSIVKQPTVPVPVVLQQPTVAVLVTRLQMVDYSALSNIVDV